ncbi:ATP-binding protein [Tumidithrix elongata RA019]|uniref:histidine kinase n=1 Tax=Tumidithrix elongata BACA0141 TaxID=2716417 RepID=A0AAW9Q1K9_9CYAN|nr:ATP-binding protein [Tumidithrix elongata RA019]
MESIDSNQSLDQFTQPQVPTCGLDATVFDALSLLKKGWTYVVVVDRKASPQGLFNAQCLLGWLDLAPHNDSPNSLNLDFATQTLADVDLQPLPAIAATTSVNEFLQRISQYDHAASIWALLDRRNRYIGVVEVLELVRQLKEKTTLPSHALAPLVSLIEQLPLPLLIHDTKGKVLGMNQIWRDSLHQNLVVPSTDSQSSTGTDAPLSLPTQDLPQHYQCCTMDGESQTWQVTSTALYGELQGLEMAIAYDITLQKQLAQELSGLSRLKDEFLACINHELKTPLTSVIGMASTLNTKTLGELNQRQSRYVNMIYQSGRHLVSIIDNIVDLAKSESGQLALALETVSTKTICQQSIQQTRRLWQQDIGIHKNFVSEAGVPPLEILLDIDPTIPTLIADGGRLQQMLVNLLSNACKFSEIPIDSYNERTQEYEEIPPQNVPTKVQIKLSVRWWEGWIAFTVTDRGIGIPEAKQHLIFQKFQQVESVLTRRFDGPGLGLVLTRHLARLHGGDVTFVSQEGVGSQFTILLPPAPPSNLELDSQVAVSHSRLVLVVETVAKDVEQFMVTLTDWGYRVVVARSGTEALEKARRLQPCLILLNPDLPMLSGWDVLALLKGDPETEHIRVVMAIDSSEPKREGYQQVDGILTKPIQPAQLSTFLSQYAIAQKPLTLVYFRQDVEEETIALLQDLGHRLLEADDLAQGEMISRIWQTDLTILNSREKEKMRSRLASLSKLDILSKLPILLIGMETGELVPFQAQFPDLRLYGCSEVESSNPNLLPFAISQRLNRVIHRAVSHLQAPTILLFSFKDANSDASLETTVLAQPLHQYLTLAGLQVQFLNDSELLQQSLESQVADVLIVTINNRLRLTDQERKDIAQFVKTSAGLPIIVIDGRGDTSQPEVSPPPDEIMQLLEVADVVLKQPDALSNLLPTLNRYLNHG